MRAQYGAIELKSVYQRYWTIALGISISIHCAIVGTYYLTELLRPMEPPFVKVHILKDITELGLPPSIANLNVPPPVAVHTSAARPTAGAPVPVPDPIADPEKTIASQIDLSRQGSPLGDLTGADRIVVNDPVNIVEEAPPGEFVPVEKDPVVVKKVEPKYPELAIKAGLEGKVWVKIWIDKEGKARQVVVLKSDAEIFNAAAIEAAKRFVFTPAYMNNGPVAVWVAVPFKFTLTDTR